MKYVIGIIVIILVIWGIASWGGDKAPVAEGAPIKIGAILPLTGPIASSGEYAKQGIEMAVQDLEAKGQKVEVDIEDYGFDSKNAVSVYNKFKTTSTQNALIVFGTPAAMPLSPLVNADHLPMLGLLAAVSYSTPNDYTYRTFGSADSEAKFASDVLVDQLGKKKIAVMYLNNDYGQSALAAFKKYIGTRATVVAEEGAAPGTTDYRAQLAKVKSAAPDAVFMATLYKEGGAIIKQAKEIGINGVFMCGQPCDNPEVITVAGTASEGLIVVAPTNVNTTGFNGRYKELYGQDPNYLTLRIYDSVNLLADAATKCVADNYSGECLKKQLDDVNGFPGLSYPITFDDNGDINDQFVVKVIKNGQYIPYN